MNLSSSRLLPCALVATTIIGACARALPDRTFKSEVEDFAVDFPAKPEERSGEDKFWAVKAFQVGERVGEDGILYSVNISRRVGGGKLVGQGVEPLAILKGQVGSFCDLSGASPEEVSFKESVFGDRFPALEYRCPMAYGERSLIHQGWMILQPYRIIRISVSYSEGLSEAVAPRYQVFLRSLALR